MTKESRRFILVLIATYLVVMLPVVLIVIFVMVDTVAPEPWLHALLIGAGVLAVPVAFAAWLTVGFWFIAKLSKSMEVMLWKYIHAVEWLTGIRFVSYVAERITGEPFTSRSPRPNLPERLFGKRD